MAIAFKDRVKTQCTSLGTNDITFGVARTNFQDWSGIPNGDTVYYCLVEANAWEVGHGVKSSGGIQRNVLASSTGSKINLLGDSDVFLTYPADKAVAKDLNGNLVIDGTLTATSYYGDASTLDNLPTLETLGIENHEKITVDTNGVISGDGGGLTNLNIDLADNGLANHDKITVDELGNLDANSISIDTSLGYPNNWSVTGQPNTFIVSQSGSTKASVGSDGSLTATSFIGDGSQLTGLPEYDASVINFKGSIDATTAPEPTDPVNGDTWLNTTFGASNWTGLSGSIQADQFIIYGSDNQWHASGGTSTEVDPTVPDHVKNITTTEKTNWNTAFSWDNHAIQGYVKSADLADNATKTWVTDQNYLTTETDPTVPEHVKAITEADIVNWNTHTSLDGYATESYVDNKFDNIVETDPTVPAHVKAITTDDITNWNTHTDPLPDQTGQTGKYLTTDGTNASWGDVAGGGGDVTVADGCIYLNNQTIANDYVFPANKNGMSAGPISVDGSVTVGDGTWTIVGESGLGGGSGEVIEPRITKASLTANQTLTVDTYVPIIFDKPDTFTSTDNWIDASTGKFQPTEAGYYYITSSVMVYGDGAKDKTLSGALKIIRHDKNGGTQSDTVTNNERGTFSSNNVVLNGSTLFFLNGVDDYVTVEVNGSISSGTSLVANANFSRFSAHLITGQSTGSSGGGSVETVNAPVFRAYSNANQDFPTNAWTKVTLNAENFDTSDCFDTSNSRFTPNVAGYYKIQGSFYLNASTTGVQVLTIYKNGSVHSSGVQQGFQAGASHGCIVSDIVYLNGSTDYVELYGFQSSGETRASVGVESYQFMSGCLVKPANSGTLVGGEPVTLDALGIPNHDKVTVDGSGWLAVNGALQSNSDNESHVLFNTGAGETKAQVTYKHSESALNFHNGGQQRMRIDTGGNVSISGNNPLNARLSINGEASQNNIVSIQNAGGTGVKYLNFLNNGGGTQGSIEHVAGGIKINGLVTTMADIQGLETKLADRDKLIDKLMARIETLEKKVK